MVVEGIELQVEKLGPQGAHGGGGMERTGSCP